MKCKKCGKCCLGVNDNYWISGLSWEDKQTALAELINFNSQNQGCRMAVKQGNKVLCLVEKVFGNEKKPVECKKFNC